MNTAITFRVLLLQARAADDPAKAEEVRSFAIRCGLNESQISSHDLLQGPPTLQELRRHDALMMGGSGEFYVSKQDLPFHDQLVEFLLQVVDAGFPTFASCFGFQYLVHSLGGQIVFDPEHMEVGAHEVSLTAEGYCDELFAHLPGSFMAQLGHKDRAADHLEGVTTLASSQRSAVQAIRIPGKPIWATQFHPELDRETNLSRYYRYLDGYAASMTPQQREQALRNFHETPYTRDLLQRFVQLILGLL